MTTVINAGVFIHNAYHAHKDNTGQTSLDTKAMPLPEGWTLFDVQDETAKDGDYAAIFVNYSTKEIFIAGRGTDVLGDTKHFPPVVVGKVPPERFASAQKILADIRKDFKGYRIQAGGHSLDGLVWAAVSAHDKSYINDRDQMPLSVLIINAPGSKAGIDGINGFNRVVAITENLDIVGNYGPSYANTIKLDVAFGVFNQFGKEGTHSVRYMVEKGLAQNPYLANQELSKIDMIPVLGYGEGITAFKWAGQDYLQSSKQIHSDIRADGTVYATVTDPLGNKEVYEGVLGKPMPIHTEKMQTRSDGLTYGSSIFFDNLGHITSIKNKGFSRDTVDTANSHFTNYLNGIKQGSAYVDNSRLSGIHFNPEVREGNQVKSDHPTDQVKQEILGLNEQDIQTALYGYKALLKERNIGLGGHLLNRYDGSSTQKGRWGNYLFDNSLKLNQFAFEPDRVRYSDVMEPLSGLKLGATSIDNSRSPIINVLPKDYAARTKTDEEALLEGFVERHSNYYIRFGTREPLLSDQFESAQRATFVTNGLRPTAFQPDPNVKPNDWLANNLIGHGNHANFLNRRTSSLLNGAALGSIAAGSTRLAYVDPLLLDLTGRGVHMTSYSNDGVLFDIDHSGTTQRTGWVDMQTGILVNDQNSGKITNISQLFSEYYGGVAGQNGLPGSRPYKDGYAALTAQDGVPDQVINARDAIWPHLKVWVDANHNAKSDVGELHTMESLGITQINLAHAVAAPGEVREGNRIRARGSFVMKGQTREVLSVGFIADPARIRIAELGQGSVLHSNILSEAFADIFKLPPPYSGTSSHPGSAKTYVSHSEKGEVLDATKLQVHHLYGGIGNDTLIAAAEGSWLVGGGGSNTYQGGAGDDVFVISAADEQKNIHGGGGTNTAIIVGQEGVTLDMTKAGILIAQGGEGNDVIFSGGGTGVYIKGGQGDSTLIGGAGDDVIVGGLGHNLIIGGTGKALIYGGPQGNVIYGPQGDSIINAGGGNDLIFAGPGNDVIKVGCGDAIIDGGEGRNMVQFHGSYADYHFTQVDTTYIVSDKVSQRDGTVTLKNIQVVHFSDIKDIPIDNPFPLPVPDILYQDKDGQAFSRNKTHRIARSQLTGNDQWMNTKGDYKTVIFDTAIGGTVKLSPEDDVLFQPDPTFTGFMHFKYAITDKNEAAVSINGQALYAYAFLLTSEVPKEPAIVDQWYLADSNILPVWKDYSGKGVRIGQFEKGENSPIGPDVFDYNHPDLVANTDQLWRTISQRDEASVTTFSQHATLVAGIMSAAKNGEGIIGVAYDAKLSSYALMDLGSNLGNLEYMQSVDVANHSWGRRIDFSLLNLPINDPKKYDSIEKYLSEEEHRRGLLTVAHAHYAANYGRGGLGTVIVFAAGNGYMIGGSSQGSPGSNSRFSIQVGAYNAAKKDVSMLFHNEILFSNPGASILVAAPGGSMMTTGRQISTDHGSVFGQKYGRAQGTSFAAPVVTGIIALMLEANPNLGYRDIQHILALTAKHSGEAHVKWRNNGARYWNGGAMHVSHEHGFGKVDTLAAARMAESWMQQNTAINEAITFGQRVEPNPKVENKTTTSRQKVSDVLRIEHVEIDLNINVSYFGDVVVKLISPMGTVSVLLDRPGDAQERVKVLSIDNIDRSARSGMLKYTFMTTHSWGETSAGDWTLQVSNAGNSGSKIMLNDWALRVYGSELTKDDTYFYTDEYKMLAASNPERTHLDDAINGVAGGRNTINTAAMPGNVIINLLNGKASLAGQALTIHNPNTIHNIVTGDGNDVLLANDGAAILDGGRGKNTLRGGSGKDIFVIRRRDEGTDTIINFSAEQDRMILVGFKGQSIQDLRFIPQGKDTHIEWDNGQSIVLKDQTLSVEAMRSIIFFQNTLRVPRSYVDSASTDDTIPANLSTITLTGGSTGVATRLEPNGQVIWEQTGKIYRHDGATVDYFKIMPQVDALDYHNTLLGFKHGIDKIDVSSLNITQFSDLMIEKTSFDTKTTTPAVHGVLVQSRALGKEGKPASILYLDALDPLQVNESDFIFTQIEPTSMMTDWMNHISGLVDNLIQWQANALSGETGSVFEEKQDHQGNMAYLNADHVENRTYIEAY